MDKTSISMILCIIGIVLVILYFILIMSSAVSKTSSELRSELEASQPKIRTPLDMLFNIIKYLIPTFSRSNS